MAHSLGPSPTWIRLTTQSSYLDFDSSNSNIDISFPGKSPTAAITSDSNKDPDLAETSRNRIQDIKNGNKQTETLDSGYIKEKSNLTLTPQTDVSSNKFHEHGNNISSFDSPTISENNTMDILYEEGMSSLLIEFISTAFSQNESENVLSTKFSAKHRPTQLTAKSNAHSTKQTTFSSNYNDSSQSNNLTHDNFNSNRQSLNYSEMRHGHQFLSPPRSNLEMGHNHHSAHKDNQFEDIESNAVMLAHRVGSMTLLMRVTCHRHYYGNG